MSKEKNKVTREEEELSFEQALARLEEVVEKLEQEDLPLEEAIDLFQEGMRLSKISAAKLDKVEQKIQILMEENGELKARPFELKEDNE